jgi:hypothetical protein
LSDQPRAFIASPTARMLRCAAGPKQTVDVSTEPKSARPSIARTPSSMSRVALSTFSNVVR